MQGLVSYSDDEDDLQAPSLPSAPGTSTASTSAPSAPSTAPAVRPRPPVASASSRAAKNQLPNLIRRAPSAVASSSAAAAAVTGAGASTSTYPPSPLRRPFDPSPDSTPRRPSSPPDTPQPQEDEAEQIRALLRPPPLKNGEGWDDEYGLKRLAEEARLMAREVDPALQAKVSQFLSLKASGTHFNDSLMKSRSFRNPTIYKKLVEFVDVDERRGLGPTIWGWQAGERERWTTERIGELQKERSEQLSASQQVGKRDRIGFTSSSSAATGPSSRYQPSASFTSRTGLPPAKRNAQPPPSQAPSLPAVAPVQSGGKAYSLVGVGGDDLDVLALGRKRDRGREGERGDRKREKSAGSGRYDR